MNKKKISLLGFSAHADHEREANDFYATDPSAATMLLKLEKLSAIIEEPACGEDHLANAMRNAGKEVISSDLIDYGVCAYQEDFLSRTKPLQGDLVTNPPYKHAQAFVEKALDLAHQSQKVCMFLRLAFLEGAKRKKLFVEKPPVRVWVSSSRIKCAIKGDFKNVGAPAAAYAWFVWEKGFFGDTSLKWFN